MSRLCVWGFMKKAGPSVRYAVFVVLVGCACGTRAPLARETAPVHMANGIKIGEVDSTSAIIWTRLTKRPERNVNGVPFPAHPTQSKNKDTIKPARFDNLEKMEGSAAGTTGEVRVVYGPAKGKAPRQSTQWRPVHASGDFTRQVRLAGLLPNTRYSVIVEGRPRGGTNAACTVKGSFRTAPNADTVARIAFGVVTGQDYPRRDDPRNGHKVYRAMRKMNLDFFVHTGDIEYYDKPKPHACSIELARFKWNRIYAMPYQRTFHNGIAAYFIKDDHDTLRNDCWPGQRYGNLTWGQGLAVFREQVPMGDKTYRTIRWGKDLQIWLVEGRDFRSANTMRDGPGKTIWGTRQKQWFFDSVRKSDASFRVLISPTPLVGPDRGNKSDNHANKGFRHEGNELRSFIGRQKNMLVVCGDRHWQYVSVDPASNVREYSCGPTTDAHAGGFNERKKSSMHRYLKVKGGFLSVVVARRNRVPRIVFRHHGVDGGVYNEDIRDLDG